MGIKEACESQVEGNSISSPPVFDPFAPKGELSWLSTRIGEGYFGPTASFDRSLNFQKGFETTSLPRIIAYRDRYRQLLTGERSIEVESIIDNEKKLVPWTPDVELTRLKREWQNLPKGGNEELDWVERAIAFFAAGFEQYQRAKGKENFTLRDNQLYYMTLLLLHKGKYPFGNLETDNRGVELPTGEGKTYCFGLVAGIFALQGEQVLVLEPNYVSAKSHGQQMAEFYESFCRITTGVVVGVPEAKGFVIKEVPDEHGIFRKKIIPTGGFKSYRVINGKLIEEPGAEGRKKAWSQNIVYADPDSLCFDWLADHQIGVSQKTGQPDLNKVTILVAEADDLMLDRARNPFVISEPIHGSEAWRWIGEITGLEALYPDTMSEQERIEATQWIIFTIWANLYEAKRIKYFQEGIGKTCDFTVIGGRLIPSERLNFKASNIIAATLIRRFCDETIEEKKVWDFCRSWGVLDMQEKEGWENAIASLRQIYPFAQKETDEALRSLFAKGYPPTLLPIKILEVVREDHQAFVWQIVSDIINSPTVLSEEEIEEKLSFLNPENKEIFLKIIKWLNNHSDIIDAALYVLLGMERKIDFIGKNQPVLLDEYGFPLERRQLSDMYQVFLQLYLIWQNEGMESKELTGGLLESLVKQYAQSIEISRTINRITLPSLLEKAKMLRFSSGSLLPAALPIFNLYKAEVLAVKRHSEIPSQLPPPRENAIITTCLDGGLAQIHFLTSEEERLEELMRRANDIKENGRMGLFIVPNIRFAKLLEELIPDAEIVTGEEELQERGLLDKVTSEGKPGKIIITTWIAHRDIDVKIPEEVGERGGLDCCVVGLAPTERGLWQALQRALRGDSPGTRSLLLTPEDFDPIANFSFLAPSISGPISFSPEKIHQGRVNQIINLWKKALEGRRSAMEELFQKYLKYLRFKEEMMQRQLMMIMIRDCGLEEWQQLFIKHQKEEDLRERWADFLRFLELYIYCFLLRADIQKLPPPLQRAKFRQQIESLLKGKNQT